MNKQDYVIFVALLLGAISGYAVEAGLSGWKEILQPIHVFPMLSALAATTIAFFRQQPKRSD